MQAIVGYPWNKTQWYITASVWKFLNILLKKKQDIVLIAHGK